MFDDVTMHVVGVRLDDRLGYTPLIRACREGRSELVSEILSNENEDMDVNSAIALNGATALMFAVCHNDVAIARLLLQAGADPNQADWYGFTPLKVALEKGFTEMVCILLDFGAECTCPQTLVQ